MTQGTYLNTNMYMVIIGMDPGANGGIAILNEKGKVLETFIMPIYKDTRRDVDFYALASILSKYRKRKPIVVLEKVHAIQGCAAATTFKFGQNYQACKDAANIWKMPLFDVYPKEWQKLVFNPNYHPKKKTKSGKRKTDTKAKALAAARKLMAQNSWTIHLFKDYERGFRPKNAKPHDGKVDALCIAYWGYRKVAQSSLKCPYEKPLPESKPKFPFEIAEVKKRNRVNGIVPKC